MPRRRKTFNVEDFKKKINERNRHSTCSAEVRRGWNSVLSDVLMDTGNYKGFNYLNADQVPPGHKPGIIPNYETGKHEFPDDSRVFYY